MVGVQNRPPQAAGEVMGGKGSMIYGSISS